MSKLMIAALLLVVSVTGNVHADEQAEARAILDQAIKAAGGEATLGKIKAVQGKLKGTEYEGEKKHSLNYEWSWQGMDKARAVFFDGTGKKVTRIEVVNGNSGWEKDAGEDTEALSKDQLESRLEEIYFTWVSLLVPLKEDGFQLSPLKEVNVEGRKAVGVLVAHAKHRPIKLYFDKETHLLVKSERRFKNAEEGKEMLEEIVFSDFRALQGTKQAFKVTGFWDKVKVLELEFKELKL